MRHFKLLACMLIMFIIGCINNITYAAIVYYDVPVNTIKAFNKDEKKAIKQFESKLRSNYRRVEGEIIDSVIPFDGQILNEDDIYVKFRVTSVAEEPLVLQNAFGAQYTYMVPKVRYIIEESKGNGDTVSGSFWRTHNVGGNELAVAIQLKSAKGKNGVRRLVKWALEDIATDLEKLKKKNAIDEKAESYM